MKPISIRLTTVTSIVLLAALFRLLPHWPNFTPIAAMALFGAAKFEKKWLGLIIPMLAMLLSDALIGFHGNMLSVYVSFALTWVIGLVALRRPTAGRVAASAIASSVLFFLITNFAVWFGSTFYSQDLQGLLTCYTAGLAFYNGQSFFLNGVFGDLFFSGVLFGGYYLLQQRFSTLRIA
ncbi:DUF6580 family putative transport protein [Arsenicibacter rosenii]|uniref:Rod shape-determining protein MreD n=1 Tax=Arsenicibacter rosenii TaxID=1750698 RepID=A0A1S2VN41_9BACT|nr:DUF6580 family putative transport protein [Arsenicibacter rosenii]OIN59208.1 hypothetical protein BLX24_09440 [Arsenicibacter rosenii]